jgi:hypothetical protein
MTDNVGIFSPQQQGDTDMTKQSWVIGQFVNVGFLKGLEVIAKRADGWSLKSKTGISYIFRPYTGIERVW